MTSKHVELGKHAQLYDQLRTGARFGAFGPPLLPYWLKLASFGQCWTRPGRRFFQLWRFALPYACFCPKCCGGVPLWYNQRDGPLNLIVPIEPHGPTCVWAIKTGAGLFGLLGMQPVGALDRAWGRWKYQECSVGSGV